MNNTADNTFLEKMIVNILETRFENFDQATIDHAKDRIIDTVGCLIGGARDAGNPELLNLIREFGGSPEATILIYGDKAPAHYTAMINSIMARSFDFEPVSPLVEGISVPGHISGTTVMTALTLGEARNVDGKEFLTALLVGDDIASRILLSTGFEFSRGWDNIGTVNTFGATAIAGRLLGLNGNQLRNAFGLVLNQLAGSLQIVWDATTAFKLCQGLSSHNGIFSARLAKAGWTGPKDALFGEFGYYRLYTEGCREPEVLSRNLGKKYYSDGTFKPYPCCRINHGAIDCALAIVNKYHISSDDIQEIIISVSSSVLNHICGQPFVIGEFPHANAAFNMSYTVATALLRKNVRPEHFTDKYIRDPLINTIINKIKLTELPEADLSAVRFKVIMKDGREFNEATDVPKGDPQNPLSKEEIISKFWTNVEFSQTINREKANQVLSMIENLESLDKVKNLTPLLVV
jgi:2-methylcitrate dehydratase PrpD